MSEETITINLTREEALVLFELLTRFSEEGKLQIKDSSEERVLWNVQCLLEKTLTEPFQANYAELLMSARELVRDKE